MYQHKQDLSSQNHVLCVVSFTEVSEAKQVTTVRGTINKNEFFQVLVTGSGGYLIGKLCIYDKQRRKLYPIDEPAYLFDVIADIDCDLQAMGKNEAIVNCPRCNEIIPLHKIVKHMDMHYYDYILEKHKMK